MQDIKSTIRIEDGFTETLENLSKSAYKASSVMQDLKDSIVESTDAIKEQLEASKAIEWQTHKTFNKTLGVVKTTAFTIAGNLKKIYQDTLSSYRDRVVDKLKEDVRDSSIESIRYLNSTNEHIKAIEKHIKGNSTLSRKQKKEAIKNLHDSYDANLKIVKGKIKNEMEYIRKLNKEKDVFKILKEHNKEYFKAEARGIKESITLRAKSVKETLKTKGALSNKMLATAMNIDYTIDNARPVKYAKRIGRFKRNYGAKVAAKEIGLDLKTNIFKGIDEGFSRFSKTEGWKIAKDFGSNFGKIAAMSVISAVSMALFDKLKEKVIAVFQDARQAIQNSLDDLDTTNKFRSLYGDNGDVARKRAYSLANEIGEDAGKVSEMAAKAAYQGIGTESFERVMRLSDKIGKLSPMQTTEGAANDLLSNIKSGHDAGSFAQLLGGGQKMERQLRRAGFERALNRGDISKALDIAEKITEQAGLTDEKYKNATSSLSENYKTIENVVSNIKHKLSEIYVEQLAPAVEKVKDFIESNRFQFVIGLVEKGVKVIGGLVADLISDLIDYLPYLGALFAMGLVAKSYLFIKNIGGIIGLLNEVRGALVAVFKLLGMQKIAGAIEAISMKQLKVLIRQKAIAAVKIVGPWLLIGIAIAGALKLLHSLFGEGKTFSEFLTGSIAGAFKMLTNVFYNVAAFLMETLPRKITIVGAYINGIFQTFIGKVKEGIGYLLAWIIDTIGDTFLGKQLFDSLGINSKELSKSLIHAGENNDNLKRAKVYADMITKLESQQTKYVDIMDGVIEAYESNGKTVVTWLKKLFNQGEEQKKDGKGVKDNTGLLVRQGEQEEELRWLKAFSDRQITSSYSSITSNVRNLTINGMSQQGMAEMGRRSLSSMPTRSAS